MASCFEHILAPKIEVVRGSEIQKQCTGIWMGNECVTVSCDAATCRWSWAGEGAVKVWSLFSRTQELNAGQGQT